MIWFKENAYRPDFAACYVKDSDSPFGYTIWDEKIRNNFYDSLCGIDMEDYLKTPTQYTITKIEGEGR